jgi:hypothetical protein
LNPRRGAKASPQNCRRKPPDNVARQASEWIKSNRGVRPPRSNPTGLSTSLLISLRPAPRRRPASERRNAASFRTQEDEIVQRLLPPWRGAYADQVIIRTSSTSCRGGFGLSVPVVRCSLLSHPRPSGECRIVVLKGIWFGHGIARFIGFVFATGGMLFVLAAHSS